LSVARRDADQEQIAGLFLELGPRMKRWLTRRGVPPAEAEDMLQDVFLGLVRNWQTVQYPVAWLMGSLRLCLYLRFRTRKRHGWLLYLENGSLEGLAPAVAPPQLRTELLWDLMTLSRLLPRASWLLLYCRFGLGLSCEETAGRLAYSPSSITKLSARAMERLRRGLPGV
jgi:DNA-directed RNA polymerase specialized sigma24 family protein